MTPAVDEATLAAVAASILARARPYRGHQLIGTRNDYPVVRIGGVADHAHRIVFQAAHGPMPPDKPWVLHLCARRRNCVETTHLYAGDRLQNARDAVRQGRTNRGSRHPKVRLTATEVRQARRDRRGGVPTAVIATRLGVARSTVWSAVNRRNWAWLR